MCHCPGPAQEVPQPAGVLPAAHRHCDFLRLRPAQPLPGCLAGFLAVTPAGAGLLIVTPAQAGLLAVTPCSAEAQTVASVSSGSLLSLSGGGPLTAHTFPAIPSIYTTHPTKVMGLCLAVQAGSTSMLLCPVGGVLRHPRSQGFNLKVQRGAWSTPALHLGCSSSHFFSSPHSQAPDHFYPLCTTGNSTALVSPSCPALPSSLSQTVRARFWY